MTLYQIIKAIQNAPTKGGKKLELLLEHSGNELLRAYLKAVYDPRIQYNTTKVPKVAKQMLSRELCADDVADMTETLTGLGGKSNKEFLTNKLACLNDEGKELLGYIIGRDIRAGIAEGTVLKAFPGLFYIPPYQRCAKATPKAKERFAEMGHFYVQTKSDGQFCYAIKRGIGNERAQAMSRAGSLYPEWLANHITYGMPEGYVAMGELLVVRDGKVLDRKTGNGILNSVLSGDGSKFLMTDSVKFLAWDMVTVMEFQDGKSDRDYELRYHDLCTITALERVPSWVVGSVAAGNNINKEHLKRKEEGTVWKNPKMKWRDCESGDKDMMKVKRVFQADYRITGFYEGEGKAKGMLGGLNLASEDNLIQFDCGSGFDDEQRKALWKIRDTLPGQIVAAEGNSIETSKSKPGLESVFLPIFLEIRTDKKVADTREQVWAEFHAVEGEDD